MIEILPLFPLGLVLLPGERLPLHIFEPRYRDLVRDCRDEDMPFGVVLFREDAMAQVGCTARITQVLREFEDGTMDILVTGEEPFRLGEFYRDRTYLRAEVRPFRDRPGKADDLLKERLITQHMRLLELAGRRPSPIAYQGRNRLSFFIAHNAGLSLEQQQEILEAKSENARIRLLVSHMETFIPRLAAAEELRKKVSSNGHFPDFPPPSDS